MDKILELLIEDFQHRKMSAEYELVLNKICEAESAFMNLLDEKQKVEYLKFSFITGELDLIEFNEFANFYINI